MGTDKRIRRILELGQALIDAPRGLSVEQYGKKHGHSRSALYRDLDVLREVGFPIKSEAGRHRVPAHFQLFGRRGLQADELLALFVARQIAGRIAGSRFDRALASLWAKATGAEGQPALVPPGDATLSVSAFRTIDYGPHRAVIETLDAAIQDRIVVRLRYRKASTGVVSDREVEPGQLHADAAVEGLFLLAFCRRRKALRVFAVQRILAATPTGERFPLRPETRSKVALRHAFGVWVGAHADPPVAVRVRFASSVAGEIQERKWHPSQVLTAATNGDLVLTMRVAEPAGLVRWLMGFGADAVVEEPRWLAEETWMRHRQASGTETVVPASGYRGRRGRRAGAAGAG